MDAIAATVNYSQWFAVTAGRASLICFGVSAGIGSVWTVTGLPSVWTPLSAATTVSLREEDYIQLHRSTVKIKAVLRGEGRCRQEARYQGRRDFGRCRQWRGPIWRPA